MREQISTFIIVVTIVVLCVGAFISCLWFVIFPLIDMLIVDVLDDGRRVNDFYWWAGLFIVVWGAVVVWAVRTVKNSDK